MRRRIPKIVIADSGTNLKSQEYIEFAKKWNFKLATSSPYHQQANGMAERTIQSVKKLIKKRKENNENVKLGLLVLRNPPVYDIYSPAQLLMSRHLRDNLLIPENKFKPKIINQSKFNDKIDKTLTKSKIYYDSKGVKKLEPIAIGTTEAFGNWVKS